MDKQVQYINWLKGLAARGGKGYVDNVDARALGRIAEEIESLRKELDTAVFAYEKELERRKKFHKDRDEWKLRAKESIETNCHICGALPNTPDWFKEQ